MALTAKQQRFVDEYLIDLNATQAAIRAGYSKKTASSQGERLLRNVEVRKYLASQREELQGRVKITQDKVLRELAKIGFSDIRKVVRWGRYSQRQRQP
ncbi:terminase small subunit [Pseudomonas sp. URMO17WK12:I11]|uniref:terminase small subunit n=1 Tax=Pseudomonas sp. URMO17WK12:I11 TaxID=1283291 RepID=UPI00119F1AD9|nr:terminase small subunit [Pseudomonas sp. URMO17WK12:I11]